MEGACVVWHLWPKCCLQYAGAKPGHKSKTCAVCVHIYKGDPHIINGGSASPLVGLPYGPINAVRPPPPPTLLANGLDYRIPVDTTISNIQYKYTNIQIYKYTNIQKYKYSNERIALFLCLVAFRSHAHTHTHARTHAHTHARTHARMHTHTHTHTHT